jgi:hypothetical protein
MHHRPVLVPLLAAALVTGGCGVVSAPPKGAEPPPPVAVAAPPSKTVEAPAPRPVAEPPPAKSAVAPSPKPVAPSAPPPGIAPAKVPKAEVRPATPVSRPPPNASATASAAAPAPSLDLKSLEQRLKESDAIGVLTKLSLKNQVDDLVAKFRAFHNGKRPPDLNELRPSFEMLLMKVLSLLQDKDAGLAKDIQASRNAIWQLLTDRDKLASQT